MQTTPGKTWIDDGAPVFITKETFEFVINIK